MHDVAIVGGGPVGVLLAVMLAEGGLDVVVVEARESISERPRAVGIHPPAVSVLAQAGIDVAGHGRPITHGVALADGRELGRLRLDGVFTLAQHHIERMLRARLSSLAPGALVLGARVQSLREVRGGHQLMFDSGRLGGPTARFIVGADGVDSAVRRAAGIRMVARRGRAHYLMADVDGDGLGDGAILAFERGGVVESFPLPGGRRRWVALVPRAHPEASVADLAAIVGARTGLHMPIDAGKASASGFTAGQRLAERMTRGSIALIGDAAHEISPIGGQGLNLGWLDARALAAILLGASLGVGPLDRSHERVAGQPAQLERAAKLPAQLERFNSARLRSARRASAQAAFNMSMGRALPTPLHASRTLAIRALASPPFGPRLADAFTMRTL